MNTRLRHPAQALAAATHTTSVHGASRSQNSTCSADSAKARLMFAHALSERQC